MKISPALTFEKRKIIHSRYLKDLYCLIKIKGAFTRQVLTHTCVHTGNCSLNLGSYLDTIFAQVEHCVAVLN